MREISIIGLDTAKSVFQLHALDSRGDLVWRKRPKRAELLRVLAKVKPCVVALEACAASHYWGREIEALGHSVKLIPPPFVKKFATGRRKTDERDAEALAFAGRCAQLRPVPVRSADAAAAQLPLKTRGIFVAQRTQLANAIRGHLGEFGHVACGGEAGLTALIAAVESGAAALPKGALNGIAALIAQWRALGEEIARFDADLRARAAADPLVKRLMDVPGVGPVTAAVFALKVDDPARFDSGRNCAAWTGLTPNERSSGGKRKLGAITKAGDEDLRSLLVMGAASVLLRAKRAPHQADPWVMAIMARRPFKVAAVALAARNARTLWALARHGGTYQPRPRAGQTAALVQEAA